MSFDNTKATVHNVELQVKNDKSSKALCAPPLSPRSTLPPVEECEGITGYENVTVKFRITENQIVAQVYPNCLTLAEVKQDIGRKFEVQPRMLMLTQRDNREVCDSVPLHKTDTDDFGIHEFGLELQIDDLSKHSEHSIPKLDLEVYYDKFRLADFITVHIPGEDTEDGNPKNIVVEIQNRAIIKPFLCGYRDKRTGVEYLDAFTQTGPYFDKWKQRRYTTRDTQTYEYKEKFLNTVHEQASQCFLDGRNVLHVSSATDFTIVPRKYQTYAQKMRLENKLGKVKLLQRNWRRWILWKYIHKAANEYRRLVANRIEEEHNFEEDVEKRIKREERAKQFPRTKDDFDLLYAEIGRWKVAEMKRIASLYEGPARVAEIHLLLDKEIQLLNGVNRQRNLVFKAMKDFRDQQLLTKLGKPISWVGYKDCTIHLDLVRTQRARFLNELLKDLLKPLQKEDRLILIRKVMTVLLDEICFPDFGELFDLFEREKNLLLFTKHFNVEILRARQNILFIELIKFQKDSEPTKPVSRMCIVCKQVKPFSLFATRTRQTHVDTCKSCHYLKMSATENNVYMSILRAVQRDERKKRCSSSFAFVLQLDDVRHIVDKIWHGHSILSKCENLYELRLPRWNKSDDWAPWNCVCLTEKESRDHYKIDDVTKIYDHKLLLEIGNRHMLARNAFHTLAAVGTEFLETGQWWKVGMNKQRNSEIVDK